MINRKFKGGSITVDDLETGSVINRILIIRFDSPEILVSTSFPSLRRISIAVREKDITVILQSEPLREYFNRFIDMFCDSVDESHSAEEILELFIESIDKIKTLLELDSRISEQVRKGLWGELTLMMKMIEHGVCQKKVLDGWHGPTGAIHDFTCQGYLLEVKTHSRTSRVVNISNEYQLRSNGDEELNLVLIKAETIHGAGTDSLREIYNHILYLLEDDLLKRRFKEKCSNIGDGYAGPDSGFYDSRYNLLSISAFRVDQESFPRIIDVPSGVSAVKYCLDISALDKFYNPNFEWTV